MDMGQLPLVGTSDKLSVGGFLMYELTYDYLGVTGLSDEFTGDFWELSAYIDEMVSDGCTNIMVHERR